MRLDKFLVTVGIGTRKEVKSLIKQKRVSVNGQIAKQNDCHIDEYLDTVCLDDSALVYKKYVYVMLHKPQGVVSATEDAKDRTVLDLLDKSYQSVFPVGRLDKNTEGLLLLTNDGKLAHDLLSPKKHIDKIYFALLEKNASHDDILACQQGVVLDDGYCCMPAKLVISNEQPNAVHITIQEGKFHQVKRMFQALGNKVIYLKRESMGTLCLDEKLALGEYRELTSEELVALKDLVQQK
ncbi:MULTISPECIES: pseudouridine synthase [unclassified Granulicatella]|uniref:pseudouridine synthase n=1 Tax=unclassified Granulicatella TaxID=2630493 RepID=UPI00107465DD|nr:MULTISPECIES: pseudouridine synthase [unclassified Granulicatella]MBF0780873.1 rRNA pseudouridine synthase [Granulicatella sp. 19428wC4_WM01]TFU93484.1 rRNA pseudouridine synthase [Granulicatella sp. WM01]